MKLYITDNKTEMEEIGKKIIKEKPKLYTTKFIDKIKERIRLDYPNETDDFINSMMLCSIYDYWTYGNTIDEELYYRFYEKNHEQKSEYMTFRLEHVYVKRLCCGNNCTDYEKWKKVRDQLEMKYRCYEMLKPYYKRDIIEIESENDYSKFVEFTLKHNEFVVKPSNMSFGLGIHKVNINDFKSSGEAFESILAEGNETNRTNPEHSSSIVIEELIKQCDELSAIHPFSINAIRITAVRDKDGEIRILHPWIKCGVGKEFVASAAVGGFDALIDENTGVVISDGFSENGKIYTTHPDTNIKIKGFKIPKWNQLKELTTELMNKLDTYGYIGWDMVLTDNGWVVMEANYAGEFIWQLLLQKGGKKEFEDLIGWKMETEFWWQSWPW